MRAFLTLSIFVGVVFFFQACAVSSEKIITPKPQQKVVVKKQSPYMGLKRKVAIARFSNEASYGKSSMFGLSGYDVSKQTTDILSTELSKTGRFILLERLDSDKIEKELKNYNIKSLNIGADYLIVGSISEFGRTAISDVGVFSRKKTQIARAKVNIRIIDVASGEIIFAQDGVGEAKSEAGKSFGLGKHVDYDSMLNDKAVSAAISSMISQMMDNLLAKPWRSYVISRQANALIMAGGKEQGVKVGDTFSVYKRGQVVQNPQTKMPIELPGTKIAKIKVISLFGENYTNEGSVASVVDGSIKGVKDEALYIQK